MVGIVEGWGLRIWEFFGEIKGVYLMAGGEELVGFREIVDG